MHLKQTGEFFIYKIDNGGENIIVISIKDARDWAQKYLDDVVYNRYFGRADESSTERDDFCCKLSAGNVAKLRRIARERGVTMSSILDNFIASLTD